MKFKTLILKSIYYFLDIWKNVAHENNKRAELIGGIKRCSGIRVQICVETCLQYWKEELAGVND